MVSRVRMAMAKLVNMMAKQPLMDIGEKRKLYEAVVRGAGRFGWEIMGNSSELRKLDKEDAKLLRQFMCCARRPSACNLLWLLRLLPTTEEAKLSMLNYAIKIIEKGDKLERAALETLKQLHVEQALGWWTEVMSIIKDCDWMKKNDPEERDKIWATGEIELDQLTFIANQVRSEALETLRDEVAGCKCFWLLDLIPEWCSSRPWHAMNHTASGHTLRRWLMNEHNLEVETGRFQRHPAMPRNQRICKRCKHENGQEVLGDERHALGSCVRGQKMKMEFYVEVTVKFTENEIDYGDDSNYLWDILKHLHLLHEGDQQWIWRGLGRIMLAIEQEIQEEVNGKVKPVNAYKMKYHSNSRLKTWKSRVLMPLS